MTGCNKEEPMPVSAEFTTDIQNNTLGTGERFTVYTDQVEGEFLAYFKGDKESNTWDTGYGTTFSMGTDSLIISPYGVEGTYTFTVVATSYGNWGETVNRDVESMEITVVAEE